MQAFQQDLKKFESLNAQVLGISPDDVETHQRFSKELGLQFPLIADTDRKIQTLYRQGRVTFVIDRQGGIRFIQEGMPKNNLLSDEVRKMGGEGGFAIGAQRPTIMRRRRLRVETEPRANSFPFVCGST